MITSFDFPLEDLREDEVWLEHIEPLLQEQVPENVFWMWNYCFTEILNNAIDHSEGTSVKIMVSDRFIRCNYVHQRRWRRNLS